MNCPHDVNMTDFKKNCVKLHGRRNRGGRGGGCHPKIFADHINRYIKNENEEKDVKFVFSCNGFLSNSQVSSSLTVIIARRE